MRIVIVGAGGQLGRELGRLLPAATTVPLARRDLDVRDAAAVGARLGALAPAAVVNCAADNRVDAAEAEPAEAAAVNALAVSHLARACRELDAVLVQVSTDYVFDGRASRPYPEDAPPNPLGVYGRTKLAGESFAQTLAPRHAIVRTAGLYAAGGSAAKGGSFLDRILVAARRGERLRVVADQVTAPTWARDVAAVLARLVPRLVRGEAAGGVYHVTDAGECSWHAFAVAALELAGIAAPVEAISAAERAAPAPRPAYSVLASTRLAAAGEPPLRHWREALAARLAEA